MNSGISNSLKSCNMLQTLSKKMGVLALSFLETLEQTLEIVLFGPTMALMFAFLLIPIVLKLVKHMIGFHESHFKEDAADKEYYLSKDKKGNWIVVEKDEYENDPYKNFSSISTTNFLLSIFPFPPFSICLYSQPNN